MTKEELEQYARENRKRLDAQEVKIGDVVKVLVGQFAGETGIVVGIIACDKSDYTGPYYDIALNCEVPEKYKCRKTLVTPNNVAGGFSAHDFEVIGNRAPKQPSSEIKVGDKVRVREDAPNLHPLGWDAVLKMNDSVVLEIEGDTVWVKLAIAFVVDNKFPIPLKYLVKVDAEAKEAKFKCGDKVRLKDIYYKEELRGRIGTIRKIAGCHIYVEVDSTIYPAIVHSIEPYTEPTEEKTPEVTRKSPSEAENGSEMNGSEAETTQKSPSEKKYGSITIPVEVDLTESFWDAYTADLAKEIAVKVANKFNAPHEAAEYAVSVAKAVVEGLKRK